MIKNTIHTIPADSFQKEVLEENMPVLILCADRNSDFADLLCVLQDFSCQCRHPVKTGVLAENFNPAFQGVYRVIGSPTFLLFEHGKEKSRLLGRADLCKLMDWLNDLTVFH